MSNDTQIRLAASDGFQLDAYLARPAGTPRGALIVVQEIFGVNSHMRSVADGFAAEGYLAISPALFDRVRPAIELGYGPDDMKQGVALRAQVPPEQTMQDLQAALAYVQGSGKVGIVGYCWGGSLAWLSACKLDGLAAAVAYYGAMLPANANLVARCPVMAHFGAKDHGIPLEGVEAFRAAQPSVEVHVYDADHGFNCDQRASYEAAAATLARERTLAFFARHLA